MHHVFEDERAAFEDFLDRVQPTHECLGVSEAFRRLGRVPPSKPILCLTFDDGFKHHVTVGKWLRARDVRATFFPCIQGLDAPESSRAILCRKGFLRPPIELFGWDGAQSLVEMDHELGCHTRTHRALADLSNHEIEDEIVSASAALQARVGPVQTFAWPFGKWSHVSEAVAEALTRGGFRHVLSALPGCHDASPEWSRRECAYRTPMEPMIGAERMVRLLAASSARCESLRWNPGAQSRAQLRRPSQSSTRGAAAEDTD